MTPAHCSRVVAATSLALALVAFAADGRAGVLATWATGDNPVPLVLDPASDYVELSAAAGSLYARTRAGEVRQWDYPMKPVAVPDAARAGVVSVGAGREFAVALKSDGSVISWGKRPDGFPAVPPEAQSDVQSISVADISVAAVKRDGTLVEWGALPFPDFPGEARTNVAKAYAGRIAAAVLKTDGSLRVAGGGFTVLPEEAKSGVVDVAIRGAIFMVKDDGSLLAWPGERWNPGLGRYEANIPPVVTRVASGIGSLLSDAQGLWAVKTDGTICDALDFLYLPRGFLGSRVRGAATPWGVHTEVIDGKPVDCLGFALVDVPAHPLRPGLFREPMGLTVAEFGDFALSAGAIGFPGPAYQWRHNGVDIPQAVEPTYRVPEAMARDGGNYTVVARNSAGEAVESRAAVVTVQQRTGGAVVSWGSTTNGPGAVPPAARSGMAMIATSDTHTVAMRRDGGILEWGQPGFQPATDPKVIPAVPYQPVAVAAGTTHSVVLGRYGFVTVFDSGPPPSDGIVTVPPDAQVGVAAIVASQGYSAVLRADRTVVAWGTASPSLLKIPAAVQGHAAALGPGPFHVLAALDDGSVAAWGRSTSGQTTVPPEATNVLAVAAGYNHSLALRRDGAVVGWGADFAGQATVPAAARSGVVAIAAAGDHSLALKSDGTVVAWGSNKHGESDVPARYQGRVAAIAAGVFHSVALLDGAPLLVPRVNPEGRLEVAWPARHAGWRVQSARSLVAPVAWADLDLQPRARGVDWVAELPVDDAPRWLRLVP